MTLSRVRRDTLRGRPDHSYDVCEEPPLTRLGYITSNRTCLGPTLCLGFPHNQHFAFDSDNLSTRNLSTTMAEHIVHTGSVTADLAQLMQGRDTRFYRGFLAKLTAIIVSLPSLTINGNADLLVVPCPHYVDD